MASASEAGAGKNASKLHHQHVQQQFRPIQERPHSSASSSSYNTGASEGNLGNTIRSELTQFNPDDFEIIDKLYINGDSAVFKAKRTHRGGGKKSLLVAIKQRQTSELGKNADVLHEAKVNVTHPHIVRCFGSYWKPKYALNMVFEWADGGDLLSLIRQRRLRQKPLAEVDIWKWAAQLFGALECLHKRRIIHRDIKCANMLLFSRAQNEGYNDPSVFSNGLSAADKALITNHPAVAVLLGIGGAPVAASASASSSTTTIPAAAARGGGGAGGGEAAVVVPVGEGEELLGPLAAAAAAGAIRSPPPPRGGGGGGGGGISSSSSSSSSNNDSSSSPPVAAEAPGMYDLKVADLGVARRLGDQPSEFANTMYGTPLYMSPELVDTKGPKYTSKTDMWSAGVSVYEMAALSSPFTGTSMAALTAGVRLGKYKPLPPIYSRELSTFITSLLRLDPQARPTAKEAYDACVSWLIANVNSAGEVEAKRAGALAQHRAAVRGGGGGGGGSSGANAAVGIVGGAKYHHHQQQQQPLHYQANEKALKYNVDRVLADDELPLVARAKATAAAALAAMEAAEAAGAQGFVNQQQQQQQQQQRFPKGTLKDHNDRPSSSNNTRNGTNNREISAVISRPSTAPAVRSSNSHVHTGSYDGVSPSSRCRRQQRISRIDENDGEAEEDTKEEEGPIVISPRSERLSQRHHHEQVVHRHHEEPVIKVYSSSSSNSSSNYNNTSALNDSDNDHDDDDVNDGNGNERDGSGDNHHHHQQQQHHQEQQQRPQSSSSSMLERAENPYESGMMLAQHIHKNPKVVRVRIKHKVKSENDDEAVEAHHQNRINSLPNNEIHQNDHHHHNENGTRNAAYKQTIHNQAIVRAPFYMGSMHSGVLIAKQEEEEALKRQVEQERRQQLLQQQYEERQKLRYQAKSRPSSSSAPSSALTQLDAASAAATAVSPLAPSFADYRQGRTHANVEEDHKSKNTTSSSSSSKSTSKFPTSQIHTHRPQLLMASSNVQPHTQDNQHQQYQYSNQRGDGGGLVPPKTGRERHEGILPLPITTMSSSEQQYNNNNNKKSTTVVTKVRMNNADAYLAQLSSPTSDVKRQYSLKVNSLLKNHVLGFGDNDDDDDDNNHNEQIGGSKNDSSRSRSSSKNILTNPTPTTTAEKPGMMIEESRERTPPHKHAQLEKKKYSNPTISATGASPFHHQRSSTNHNNQLDSGDSTEEEEEEEEQKEEETFSGRPRPKSAGATISSSSSSRHTDTGARSRRDEVNQRRTEMAERNKAKWEQELLAVGGSGGGEGRK